MFQKNFLFTILILGGFFLNLNGILGNFINLPIQFLSIILGFVYVKDIRLSSKEIRYISLVLFIPSITLYIIAHWIGTIYFFLSVTLFFYKYTQQRITLFYMCILFLVAILTDHAATLLVGYANLEPTNETIQLLLRVIIFSFFFAFTMIGFKSFWRNVQRKVTPSFTVQLVIIFIVLSLLIVFYYNIFRALQSSELTILKDNMLIFSFYFILICILIIIILYIGQKAQRLRDKEQAYQDFGAYINSLEKVNKDMQKFRHDYLNILLSIQSYINEKDLIGLKKYFTQNIAQFENKTLSNNKILGNLEKLHVKGLKGLLHAKSSFAIEHDLTVSLEIESDIHHISMDIILLNRILGILMDNAIENCLFEKTNNIQFALLQSSGMTIIVLRNKIKHRHIPVDRIFQEGYTTKTEGKGLGLATVKNIVDNCSNVTLNIWTESYWFCVEVLIMEE